MGLLTLALGVEGIEMPSAYSNDAGVFQNKLGLTDAHQLNMAEYELATIRADELLTGGVSLAHLGYGLERLTAIHQHLFQDIYEWAGKLRTVYSTKRSENGFVTRFAAPKTIQSEWQELTLQAQAFVSGSAGSEQNFAQQLDALVEIFIGANYVHAFPDGNGRSLQVFMMALAQEQSIGLDYTRVKAKDWNHACALSGEHGRMLSICISLRRKLIQSRSEKYLRRLLPSYKHSDFRTFNFHKREIAHYEPSLHR